MNDVNWEEAYKLTERLRDENTRLRSVNAQLLAALRVMVNHAEEKFPHFECPRGYRDIDQAKAAIALAESEPKP